MIENEKLFLEIKVIQLHDPNCGERDILDIIKNRFEKIDSFQATWTGTDEHPKIRFDFSSREVFEQLYCRGLDLLDRVMGTIKNTGKDLNKFLFSDLLKEVPDDKEIYLILKYITNYKKPMRANYNYLRWFAEYFHELTRHEEVVDGFLHFYKRRIDFINGNLDKLDPEQMRQWLKNRNTNLSEDVIQQFLALLPRKE